MQHNFNLVLVVFEPTELKNKLQTLDKEAGNPDVGDSSGSDSTVSYEVTVCSADGVNDVAAAVESGSQPPDGSLPNASDITSGAIHLRESSENEKSLVELDAIHHKQDLEKRTISVSEVSAVDARELDGHHTTEESKECENAHSGAVTLPPRENKSSSVSLIGCDATSYDGDPLNASEAGKGKEDVGCKLNGEVGVFKHDCGQLNVGPVS